MTFDPSTFLDLARRLEHEPTGAELQARLRTAIGRAYYAVVLTLKARINAASGADVVPSFGTHSALLRALKSVSPRGEGVCGKVKRQLESFRELREEVDYELRDLQLAGQVAEACDRADRLLVTISSISSEMLKSVGRELQ